MAKGISFHIGVNTVDVAHYGTDAALEFCEADAQSMYELAVAQGFDATISKSAQATRKAVIDGIHRAARELSGGDLFFLSYAGHGGQVKDVNRDERMERKSDTVDETWCLFDGQLIDDELAVLWSEFDSGVRILAIVDSCHSGTATRFIQPASGAVSGVRGGTAQAQARFRALTRQQCTEIYLRQRDFYDGIQRDLPSILPRTEACVLLLAGCQDRQRAGEAMGHGLFTQALIDVWDGGAFSGNYAELHAETMLHMPDSQSPNFYVTGRKNPAFIAQRPFTIFA